MFLNIVIGLIIPWLLSIFYKDKKGNSIKGVLLCTLVTTLVYIEILKDIEL